MQGSLSEFTLAQLLQFFALAERSGTITVRARGRESRLLVEGDRVIGWGLDTFDARARLLECELIPAPAIESLTSVAPRRDTPGLSFVVRNLVEPERWAMFAHRQMEQDVYPLLSVEEGEFDIQVMRCPPSPLRISIPINSVILDGSRWESEIEAADLEGYKLDSVWQRVSGWSPPADIKLSGHEWMVWAVLTAPATIGNIARRVGAADLATIAAIKEMQSLGMIAPAR